MKINKQEDIKDCGIEVIKSLHYHFFHNNLDNNQIKNKTLYGKYGINIKNLIKLGSIYGLLMEAYEVSFDVIQKNYKNQFFVAIIENKGINHYIIFKIKNNKVIIWDSLKGKYFLSFDDFKKIYKNSVLTIEKDKYKLEKTITSNPFKYLFKNWNILLLISISIIFSLVFMFTFSLFIKIMIDKIIPQKLEKTLLITTLSFLFLTILRVFNNYIKSFILKKLEIRINFDITFLYLNKLKNANLNDINKITTTDNLRRIGLIEPVSKFIASSFFVVFHESLLFIVSCSLLIFTSIKLFAIALFSGFFIFLTSFIFKYIINKNYDSLLKENLNVFSNFIEIVNSTNKLKNKNFQKYLYKKFKKDYYNFRNRSLKIWHYSNFQDIIENIFSYCIPIFIIYFGAFMVFESKLTIGSLLFFVSIYTYFINPIESLTSFLIEFPIQKKNINLLNFILLLESEKLNKKGLQIKKLENIFFKNVVFGYDKAIIKINNFEINESLIIKGKNGSGKSTFLKNIKYLDNFKGEIKINNISEKYYSKNKYRNNVIYISSEEYFPNITIFEYITNLDKEMIKTFKNNLIKFNLLKILENLNINLNLKMENNASNLSSGQKQIVSVFKLFNKKYLLILLDEAFENIDAENLKLIKKAINNFQKGIKIEVSHSKKYLTKGKMVNIEKFN